jgi:hypothetical protein
VEALASGKVADVSLAIQRGTAAGGLRAVKSNGVLATPHIGRSTEAQEIVGCVSPSR